MSRVNDSQGAAPLFGALSFMTLNINGFRTKAKKGSRMVLKYRELGRHMLAKNVDFAGIQEPHLSPQASKMGEFKEVRDFFHNMGYELMPNFLGEGRGGAALVWNTSR